MSASRRIGLRRQTLWKGLDPCKSSILFGPENTVYAETYVLEARRSCSAGHDLFGSGKCNRHGHEQSHQYSSINLAKALVQIYSGTFPEVGQLRARLYIQSSMLDLARCAGLKKVLWEIPSLILTGHPMIGAYLGCLDQGEVLRMQLRSVSSMATLFRPGQSLQISTSKPKLQSPMCPRHLKQEETTFFASKVSIPWTCFNLLSLGVANPLRVYSFFCSEPTLVSNFGQTGGTVFEIAKKR